MFGAQKSNTFGGTGLNLGGFSSPGATTGFGATKTPFGVQSGFGTTGGSPTTSGAFGLNSLNKLSTFPGTGGILGGGFGSPSVPPAFGAQPAQTTGFGGFGASSGVGGFGTTNTLTFGAPSAQQQQGTGAPPFKPTEKYEDSTNNSGKTVKVPTYLHVITSMTEYATKSFEELRFEDYNKGNKTGAAGGMNTGFGGMKPVGFGTSSSTGSPFGSSSTTNAFGSTTATAASPFGGGAAFGSTPASTGLTFGASTASSPFGGGSAFGASSQPAFGAKPAATTGFGASGGFGGFGSTSSTPAFGTTSGTPAFGSTAPFGSTGGAFGSTPGGFGAATAGNTGGFGSTGSGLTFGSTPTTTFGSTAGTGAFGSPGGFGTGAATTGFGGFGATNTNTQSAFGSASSSSSAPFGSTATGSSPFGGGGGGLTFGASGQQQSAFGKPAGGLGFGSTTPGAFGAKAATSPFGTTSGFGQQPSATGAFGQASIPAFGTTGGFGSPSGTTGFGAFGAPAAGSGFGGSAFGTTGGTTGGFGAAGASPFGTTGAAGGFGTGTTQGAPAFGALGGGGMQSTGGFGSAFGASTTTASGFGTGATGGFGATGTGLGTTGGFGGTTGGFGTGSLGGFGAGSSLGSGFGGAASPAKGFGLGGSSFGTGATSASPGFGGLSTGLGLGQSSGFGGTSGFGTTPTVTGFGSTLGNSGFGAPSTGFGAGSSFGGFGATDPNKQSQGFQGFGSSLLGGPQGGTGLGLGGMGMSGGQPMGMTNMTAQPTHSSAVLGPMFEQLKQRKKDVLEIRLNQKEPSPSPSVQAPGAALGLTSPPLTRSRQAPRSSSRITPRTPRTSVTAGLTSTSLSSAISVSGNVRSESSLLSPDLFFAKSSKKLVIDPHHPDDFDPGADLPMPPQRSLTHPPSPSPYLNGSAIMDMSLTTTSSSTTSRVNPSDHPGLTATTTATPIRRDGAVGGDIATPGVMESPSFQLNRADLPGSGSGIPGHSPSPSFAAATPSLNRLNLHNSDDALNTPYSNTTNHISQGGGGGGGVSYANRFQSDVDREHLTPSTAERTIKDTTSNGFISSVSNLMNGTRLSDQIGASPPQNDRDVAPLLTKSGYFSNPDIRILREMSASELKSVPKFAVFRPGIGRIEWEGETDVRGLDLDKIVRIEPNTVDVYEDEEAKPEVGRGLNKPAIIILNKVFPKSTATSLKKREEFINKLRASCEKNGSEFLDYDEDSGDWVLRALHFSRYGLADDSDEEGDGQVEPPPTTSTATTTVINTSSKKKSGGTSVSFARNISSPFPDTPGGVYQNDQENDFYLSNNDFTSSSYRGGGGGGDSTFLSPISPPPSSLHTQSTSHQNFLRSGARVEDLYTTTGGLDGGVTTSRAFTPMSVVSSSSRTRQGTPFPKGNNLTGASTPTTPSTPLFRNTFRGSFLPYTPLDGDASSSGIGGLPSPPPYHPYKGGESMDMDIVPVPSYQQRLPSFSTTASPYFGGRLQSDDNDKTSKPEEIDIGINIAQGTSTYEPIHMPNYHQRGLPPNAVIPEEFLAAARIPMPSWPSQESPCMKIMLALRKKSGGGTGGQSTKCTSVSGTETIRPPRSPRDMALFMGHSFRVSWSADGRIAHSGKPLFQFHSHSLTPPTSYNVTVEKVDTFRQLNIGSRAHLSEADRRQLLFLPLDALLQVSSMSITTAATSTPSSAGDTYHTGDIDSSNNNIDVAEEDQIPRWQTPRVNAWAIDHEYVLFTQMLKKLTITFSELQSSSSSSSSSAAAILVNPLFEHEKSCWVILQTVKLVEALCGQHPDWLRRISSGEEKGDVIVPLFEKRLGVEPFLWEQRRESLSLWLKQLVEAVVAKDASQSAHSGGAETEAAQHSRVLELLSRGLVEEAVDGAKSCGLSRLATLLSLLHGDDTVKQLVAKQLLDWREQMVAYGGDDSMVDALDQEEGGDRARVSGESHVIPSSLLAVYAVLGGAETMLGVADIGIDSILRNMNWMNALAMLFWYGGSSVGKLHTALCRYEEALEYQLVRPPLSPADASMARQQSPPQGEEAEKSTPSAIFSLLQVLLSPENSKKKRLKHIKTNPSSVADGTTIQCLDPLGFGSDLLDYRGSYLVLSLLESLQLIHRNTVTASIVRAHTIFQLLSEGLWHWAVFVALQMELERDRQSMVKDIVCRYCGYNGWEKEVDSLEKFLVERLNVPEKWIHMATACRCKCQGDAYAETAYLTLSGLWKEADAVVCHTLAPLSFFASNTALMKLQDLLVQMESHVVDSMYGNIWRLGGGVILDYLRLKESIQEFGRIADDMDGEEELNNLITEITTTATSLFIDVSKLMEIFTSRNRNLTSQPPSTSMYQIMLFEMGSYLFKILSEFHTKSSSNSEIYSLEELKTAPIILAEGGRIKNISGRKSFGVILEDC